jgi:hypothetical protein
MYGHILHADVLKLKLDPTHFQVLSLFYAYALLAWHNMDPAVNPNIQSFSDLIRIPIKTQPS